MTSRPPLPNLLTVSEIQQRLELIFPAEFPERKLLVSNLSAKVLFVSLYGGFVEGSGRCFRPSNIYLFTEDQSQKITEAEREAWLSNCNIPGYRTPGVRWYADTSRESIRDDLMRNQFYRLGILQKLPGFATTSSKPINFLSAEFATLFNPELRSHELDVAATAWRSRNLGQATLQRMALRAYGLQARTGDLLIKMPDDTTIRMSAGPSSLIAKGLIEDFSRLHLVEPAVIWISASDKKELAQYIEISKVVGFHIDVTSTLPDLILADMQEPIKFLFCEIVATDGPITDARKMALLEIVRASSVPVQSVAFLTAFESRDSAAFRKAFSSLAADSLVWFRTEPDLLVVISTAVARR